MPCSSSTDRRPARSAGPPAGTEAAASGAGAAASPAAAELANAAVDGASPCATAVRSSIKRCSSAGPLARQPPAQVGHPAMAASCCKSPSSSSPTSGALVATAMLASAVRPVSAKTAASERRRSDLGAAAGHAALDASLPSTSGCAGCSAGGVGACEASRAKALALREAAWRGASQRVPKATWGRCRLLAGALARPAAEAGAAAAALPRCRRPDRAARSGREAAATAGDASLSRLRSAGPLSGLGACPFKGCCCCTLPSGCLAPALGRTACSSRCSCCADSCCCFWGCWSRSRAEAAGAV